jgi:hypothetical protein
MSRRLTAGLICISLLLAITPLDRAMGTRCPGRSAAQGAPNLTDTCPDSDHRGDSCPDDCQCLCCPGARLLNLHSATPRLAPPQPSACDAPSARSCNSSDFVDRIFHPPRRS